MNAQDELKLAMLLLEDGNASGGLAACDRACTLAPEHHLPRTIRGAILSSMGDFKRAEQCLRKTIRRWPDTALPQIHLAECHLLQGRLKAAAEQLESAATCGDLAEHQEFIELLERYLSDAA